MTTNQDPFGALAPGKPIWPAQWIARDDGAPSPHVTLYALAFSIDEPWTGRLHASGDEWFELFLDGEMLLRGPGISSPRRWLYGSAGCALSPGPHTLVARVFAPGQDLRPEPVMSVCPGFLCCTGPDDKLLPRLATGVAPWKWRDATAGWTFRPPGICDQHATACGPFVRELPAAGDWAPRFSDGAEWSSGLKLRPARIGGREVTDGVLFPNAAQPPTGKSLDGLKIRRVDEATWHEPYGADSADAVLAPWREWVAGGTAEIPAGQRRRVLIDADDYLVGFAHLRVAAANGACIAMTWTERLMACVENGKCWGGEIPRGRIDGLFVVGPRDEWHVTEAGEWGITTPWKRCGRYLEIVFAAGAEGPLRIGGFRIEDALAPSPLMPPFACDNPLVEGIQPSCRRVLETGLSSAFCDCPYYEQVQWVGDMYPILLCHLAAGRDEAVYRQALQMVADGVQGQNPTQARFPIRPEQGNSVILSFSLWYVAMAHDYALWRGHRDFVRSLMPALRRNVDLFLARRLDDGFCATPPGWNYFDWASGWQNGSPPSDARGVSGLLNLLIAHACRKLAALETWLGEPELAARWRRIAGEVADACHAALWDAARGCYRDAPGLDSWSEHVQALAMLDPAMPAARETGILAALAESETKDFCTRPGKLVALKPFFSHHLFEALVRRGRIDALWRRLAAWQCLIDLDFRTTPESMPGTRSDCHGWSAHPLFHAIASFAGIRPASFGFESVIIRPQLGPITKLDLVVCSPRGEIAANFHTQGGNRILELSLPDGLRGRAELPDGSAHELKARNTFSWRL